LVIYSKSFIFLISFIIIIKYSFRDQWLNLNYDIDEPSNIKWQNITYNQCKRAMRFMVSILFGFILIVCSFAVVVYGKYAQKQYVEKYNPDLDCEIVNNWKDYNTIIARNRTLADVEYTNAKVNCYCNEKFFDVGLLNLKYYNITSDVNNQIIYPCNDWLDRFLQYQGLMYGIIIVIPLINAIVVIVQIILTNFERNKNLTEDLSSNMFKCFITQFLNTAIVLLLVNLRIDSIYNKNPDFFIFTGLYDDLSPSWYVNTGATIAFTMFINIFTPHLSSILMCIFYKCLRCCDSGCSMETSKKLTKKGFYSLYVGPEFRIDTRYSQVNFLI
jgi:hypothetical protein